MFEVSILFSDLVNICVIVLLLTLVIYHIIVYIQSRENSSFYLIFYCIGLIAFIVFSSNNLDKFLYPSMEIRTKFGSIMIHVSILTFLYFFIKLVLELLNIPANKIKLFYISFLLIALAGLTALSISIKSFEWYEKYMFPIQMLLNILSGAYGNTVMIILIIKEKKYKNKELILLTCFFTILAIDIILDRVIGIFGETYLFRGSFFGLGISTIIFVYMIASRYNAQKKILVNLNTNLEELNTNLEQKVKERTIQLEKANEQKTNFFVNMAHEVKTPLTMIKNYLEEYLKRHSITQELSIVKSNLDGLLESMINFLDFERLSKGNIIYNHNSFFNLSMYLQEKVIMFKDIASNKKLSIQTDIKEKVIVKINPEAMDRIVNNLFSNAIKYTDQNGLISISLDSNDKEIKFSIGDTGIGIPEDEQTHIFTPYYRISHKKKNIEGTGMGLNIVQKIVESIHGKITVTSKEKRGSIFTIMLPYHKPDLSLVIHDFDFKSPVINDNPDFFLEETIYDSLKPVILVVEDNHQMLLYLQNQLSTEYNFYYAKSGKEALDLLQNITLPDIIISDIMMDNMDGVDLIKSLHKESDFNATPFIFLTAKSGLELELEMLNLGAVEVINKPFKIDILKAKIETHIKLQRIYKDKTKTELKETNLSKLTIFCKINKLTPAQSKVTELIYKGYRQKEIAGVLKVSVSTIRNHVRRIYEKVNVSKQTELVNKIVTFVDENM